MPWKKSDGTYIKEGKAWVGVDGTKYPSVWTRFSDEELKKFGLTWEDPSKSLEPYDDTFYWGRNAKLINKGLKTIWVEKTKETANNLLSKWDWKVVRKSEKNTAIDSDVATYRDAVRTKCASIETAINNCSNLTQFMALFDLPVDSDGNPTGNPAPIYDFPDEI